MRRRRFIAAAAVAAAALVLVGCRPVEANSGNTTRVTSKNGATTKSVHKVYTVQQGDTLYSIAQRECGSGAAVDALAAANVGRKQPDGSILKDPNLLKPGWKLVLSCQTVSQ